MDVISTAEAKIFHLDGIDAPVVVTELTLKWMIWKTKGRNSGDVLYVNGSVSVVWGV